MSCKQLLIQFSINFVRVRFHGKILVNIIGWLLCSCYGKHTFLYLYLRRPLLLEIYRVAKSFRQRIYFIKKKKLKNVHPCNEFSFFLKKSSFFVLRFRSPIVSFYGVTIVCRSRPSLKDDLKGTLHRIPPRKG